MCVFSGSSLSTDSSVNSVSEADSFCLDVDSNIRFSVWVSFCEIYNDNIHDLLEQVRHLLHMWGPCVVSSSALTSSLKAEFVAVWWSMDSFFCVSRVTVKCLWRPDKMSSLDSNCPSEEYVVQLWLIMWLIVRCSGFQWTPKEDGAAPVSGCQRKLLHQR